MTREEKARVVAEWIYNRLVTSPDEAIDEAYKQMQQKEAGATND